MVLLRPLVRVRSVEPLDGFRVRLSFEDGTQRDEDLTVYLLGPIFEPIRNDPDVFRSVRVEGGTVAWPNGADIDPDVLYYGLRPAWMEGEQAPVRPVQGSRKQAPAGLSVRESTPQYGEPSEAETATSSNGDALTSPHLSSSKEGPH
jgi:hypothetical protein